MSSDFEQKILTYAKKLREPQTAYYTSLVGAILMLIGSIWWYEARWGGYLFFASWSGAFLWVIGFGLYLYTTNWVENTIPDMISLVGNFVLLIQSIRYIAEIYRTLGEVSGSKLIVLNPAPIIISIFAMVFAIFLMVLKRSETEQKTE